MVDVDKIQRDLYENFEVDGSVKIDPSTGVVDVSGSVTLRRGTKQLPVKFGTVSGDFYCTNRQLISLAGAPNHVGGDFYCSANQLGSLDGAPDYVGDNFWCPNNRLISLDGAPDYVGGNFWCSHNQLTSLEGAPSYVSEFKCSYSKSLPLLRLLAYPKVTIYDVPYKLEDIINKYAGQGKPGALKAAAELIRAGFKGNARW